MTQEQEYFYRHTTLILDNTKETFVDFLDFYLQQQGKTLQQFIEQHQHFIYHLCYNKYPCCQCPPHTRPHTKGSRVIHLPQLDILLDKHGGKLPNHNPGSPSAPHCCSPVNPGLTLEKLDITLLRVLLVNFVPLGSAERKAVEDLTAIRNESFAHARQACMTDGEFKTSVTRIQQSLLVLANVSGRQTSTLEKFNKVCQQPVSLHFFHQEQARLLQEANLYEKIKEIHTEMKRVRI